MSNPVIKRELIEGAPEPVATASELRRHLFAIYDNTEDSFLDSLIEAATNHAEEVTWRKFVSQKWRLYLDAWPEEEILLPFGSVLSVDLFKWLDKDSVDHTLVAGTDFIPAIVGDEPKIIPFDSWPATDLYDAESIRIEFVAGYGDASKVPASIKHAILMLAAHWYENRETVIVGTTVRQVPMAFDALISPFKLRHV